MPPEAESNRKSGELLVCRDGCPLLGASGESAPDNLLDTVHTQARLGRDVRGLGVYWFGGPSLVFGVLPSFDAELPQVR
jgi:hypothetical protein